MNQPDKTTSYWRRTVARDLTLALLTITTIIFLVFGLVTYGVFVQRTAAAQTTQWVVLANNLANALSQPMQTGDMNVIRQIAAGYEQAESTAGIRVFDANGQLIYETTEAPVTTGLSILTRPILYEGQTVGEVTLSFSGQIVSQLRRNISTILFALLFATLLGIVLVTQWVIRRLVSQPLDSLATGIDSLSRGDYTRRLPAIPQADVNHIAQRVNDMAEQINLRDQDLRELIDALEQRVNQRTRDLGLAAEIGRTVSQIRDLNELLTEAVELIRVRFDLYHVQIYLLDERGEYLVLQASTGAIGRQLLVEGHRLPITLDSINGQAVLQKRAVMVQDTATSPHYRAHPLLTDTQAETAVPLILGPHVLGVLDLQSDNTTFFSPESVAALEIMAGLLTVAIANANLFKDQARLTAELQANGRFLDSVIENIPLMVFIKEAKELRFVRWNKAGADLVGLPAETFLGKTDYDFFPPEEADFFVQKDRQVLDGGVLVDIPEEPIETADKGTRLLHTIKVPLLDANGQPQYLLGISQDITDQKIAAYALAERVKELRLLNDIGHKTDEKPAIPDFLRYVADRIPAGMQFPDICLAAITFEGQVYGHAPALDLPCQIVEGLRVGGERVGQITIAYTEQQIFLNEESALIGDMGRRISNYIESVRLLEKVQANVNDLQIVAEISAIVAAARRPQQLLEDVADIACARFKFYHAQVYLYDERRMELALTAASGPVGRQMVAEGRHISLGAMQSLVAHVARVHEGLIVNDVQQETGFLPHPLLPQTRAELAVPLLAGDKLLGVWDVQATERNRFTDQDLNIQMTLAAQVGVALQNVAQYEETQVALAELNALQRLLTREGWADYLRENSLKVQGFVAGQEKLQPIGEERGVAQLDSTTAVTVPMQVRGITIGALGVRQTEERPFSNEDHLFLEAVGLQVAEALEKSRLFAEMEQAQSQTEALFAGSERVVRATTMDDILRALVDVTELKRLDTASLVFFDEPWQSNMPATLTIAALWRKDGVPPQVDLNTPLPSNMYPILKYLSRERPFLSANINEDPLLDEETRYNFAELRQMNTAVAIPLVTGDLWIGFVVGLAAESHLFSEGALRQLTSLAGQAATVAQTLRLFSEAQARAEHEQLLRLVSDRVYAAVDAESMLRTAAEEIGRALGMETFVYLTGDDNPMPSGKTNGRTLAPYPPISDVQPTLDPSLEKRR
jgi:PAS domain S-box-containing protein